MTYRCGIGPGMERLGLEPRDPHIVCDGCGLVRAVTGRGGVPAAWFLADRAAPGWKLVRHADETQTDYCPRCKVAAP
jgi:hypothetical protein